MSNAFDFRVEATPEEWAAPLVAVVDTAAAVLLGIKHELKMDPKPELVLGLTQMVLDEHRYQQSQQFEEKDRE